MEQPLHCNMVLMHLLLLMKNCGVLQRRFLERGLLSNWKKKGRSSLVMANVKNNHGAGERIGVDLTEDFRKEKAC